MIPEFGTILGRFPSFTTLNFSYVMLNGSLPASWGKAFRYLKHLEFSFILGDPVHIFNSTLPEGVCLLTLYALFASAMPTSVLSLQC